MTRENELLAEPPEAAPLPDRTGLEDTLSPVDLPPLPDEHHPLRWTTTVVVVTTAFLALFNASALQGWAYELAPGPYTARVVAAADGWYGFTARLGLDRPVALMHGWWQSVKAAELGGGAEALPDDDADLAPPPPAVPETPDPAS